MQQCTPSRGVAWGLQVESCHLKFRTSIIDLQVVYNIHEFQTHVQHKKSLLILAKINRSNDSFCKVICDDSVPSQQFAGSPTMRIWKSHGISWDHLPFPRIENHRATEQTRNTRFYPNETGEQVTSHSCRCWLSISKGHHWGAIRVPQRYTKQIPFGKQVW